MGELLRESFNKKVDAYPIEDESIYQRIQDYLVKYDCGEFLEARDQNGELHAMMVWIHDAQSAYYLIGGSASAYKNSGAMSLLMWEAIKKSKLKGIAKFNFEGSMIPSVEKYLRGFGGELTSYSCLIKNKSKSLKVLRKLKK
jgi:lipid II:glycine glycyltransferase (peptidoglycan interpeptide bridge formation enzyme)